MNKEKYLATLKKELHSNKVEDINDIITEYEEHFSRKISDGYSEEEIVAKLEKPEIIAKQYVLDTDNLKDTNVFTKIGVILLDIVMFILDAMLYPFVIALVVMVIGFLALGVYMLIGGGIEFAPIPTMPVIGRILIGISTFALSIMTVIGTIYYTLFVNQINKAYFHWHKKVMTGCISPAHSTTPKLSGKLKRKLRNVTFISLLIFVVAFVVFYMLMTISAGSLEYWHVWHWFE